LASFLHDIISEKSPKSFSKIENSFHLAQKLRGRLETNYSLISLDVISLFINIPLDLAIESEMELYKKNQLFRKKNFL